MPADFNSASTIEAFSTTFVDWAHTYAAGSDKAVVVAFAVSSDPTGFAGNIGADNLSDINTPGGSLLLLGSVVTVSGAQLGSAFWETQQDVTVGVVAAHDTVAPYIENDAYNNGSSLTASVSVTSPSDSLSVAVAASSVLLEATTGTERVDNDAGTVGLCMSTIPGAGTNVHDFSLSLSSAWEAIGANFKGAAGGGGGGAVLRPQAVF